MFDFAYARSSLFGQYGHECTGDFTGKISFPYANNSRINIDKVNAGSQLYIHATDGDINIGDLNADIAKLETTKGDVNVTVSGKDIDVTTVSGDINVNFKNTVISNQIDLISASGDVNFNVLSELAFMLKIYDTNGTARKDGGVRVSWLDEIRDNPIVVNGGNKVVTITTNKDVNVGTL